MTRPGKPALVAAVCAALAGCTSPSQLPVDDTGGPISGTVTLWHLDEPRPEFLMAVKDGFEAEYPGTTVDLVEVPEDGYVTKVDTAILAHQPPDVAFVYEPRWMKAGSVVPLDDVIDEQGIETDVMNQVALSECELDGSLYCLGSLTGSVVLLYNKDLFDQAGVAYPSSEEPMTIDEYGALVRDLHRALGDVFGGVAGAPFTWASRTTHFSGDGRTIAGVADDDATIHMYEVLSSLVVDGASPTPSESELVSPADMLGAGRTAMAITDMEYAANALELAGSAWGAAPPPVEVAGDPSFVFVGTDKYGVFADAQNPAAARALVAYIATEGNRLRVEVGDQPPLDNTMLDAWAGENVGRQEVVSALSTSTEPGLFVPGFWEVTATLADLYGQMCSGETVARPAITSAVPAMQEKLDREWQTWESIE